MPIFRICETDSTSLKPFFSLTDREGRLTGTFVAESPNVIFRALEAGLIPEAFMCEEKVAGGVMKDAIGRFPAIPVFIGSSVEFRNLTGYELTRGALCLLKRPTPPQPQAVLEGAKRICVLHDVCDAANIGQIFRTAAALGFDGILLSSTSCDPLNRRAIRVSMGTVFQIKWAMAEDVISELRQAGFTIATTALKPDTVSLEDFRVEKDGKYAVVFGSEGYGLPDSVISSADVSLCIPMHHGVDSLNVGAAAAILLWHFRP